MKPFSFYSGGIRNIVPTKEITINELYGLIISDKYKSKCEKIRTGNSTIKTSLDYVTVSGVFSKRNESSLIEHSGLICLDIDKVSSIVNEKHKLNCSEYPPVLLFTSPSGNGVKAIYRIDINDGDHENYFNAFVTYFENIEVNGLDIHAKEKSRAMYLTFDPEAIYNIEAPVLGNNFLRIYSIPPTEINYTPPVLTVIGVNNYQDEEKVINIMTRALKKEYKFEIGQRNEFILRLASSLNRVGLSMESTENHLLKYEEDGFCANEIKATIKQAYKKKELHGVAPLSSAESVFSSIPSIDITYNWEKYRIDLANPIAPPEPLIVQLDTNIPMLHRRNLSTIAASAKSGKTFLVSGIAIAALHQECFLGLHCPKEKVKVLFVDTEQDKSDTLEVAKRVHLCNDWETDKNNPSFVALNLREQSIDVRSSIIEDAIKDYCPDLVLLDGIVDIVGNFNDIPESKAAVEQLTRWATVYDCHVMTCLHVNKGSAELRGHLGAFLRQKGELTLLLTKKDGDIPYIEVKSIDSRHRPIDDFYFRINPNALPESYIPKETPRVDKFDTIFKAIIPPTIEISKAELLEKVMSTCNVKKSMGHRKIKEAVNKGVIELKMNGYYRYRINSFDECKDYL